MKPAMFAFASLLSLAACAADDAETAETAQDLTTIDPFTCEYTVNLVGKTDQVEVSMLASTLTAKGCNHAVVYAVTGGDRWRADVDWYGTTGQCAIGWLDASFGHYSGTSLIVDEDTATTGLVTSMNPPACQRPKLTWTLLSNAKNRIGEKAYYFQNGNAYLVNSTVTFTRE